MRLREEWLKEEKEKAKAHGVDPVESTPKTVDEKHKKRSSSGIIVKGIDNCLVRLAGCCNPVAGDAVIGFITKGRGVSVHRADCVNMKPENLSDEDKLRLIEVSWDENKSSSYIANIRISGQDRDGLLLDVTNILVDQKIPCKSANAFVNKSGEAVIQVGVEIRHTSDLALLTKKFKQLQGVESVTRSIL